MGTWMGLTHRLASHTKLPLIQNEGICMHLERIGYCQRTSYPRTCRSWIRWTRTPICCLSIWRINPSCRCPAEEVKTVAAPVLAAPLSTGRVIAAPALPQSSQFQSQDEFGNLAYGYANLNSAKQETGNTYGGVTGSYSYTDSNGIVQTVNYIADGLGFRVQATNLPVAPVAELAQPVHEYELPVAPVFEGV